MPHPVHVMSNDYSTNMVQQQYSKHVSPCAGTTRLLAFTPTLYQTLNPMSNPYITATTAPYRASGRGPDHVEASNVRPQYRRYNHRPIGLLEVLQDRHNQSGHSACRGVQSMHKLGRRLLLGALLAALPGGVAAGVGAVLLLPTSRPALPTPPSLCAPPA